MSSICLPLLRSISIKIASLTSKHTNQYFVSKCYPLYSCVRIKILRWQPYYQITLPSIVKVRFLFLIFTILQVISPIKLFFLSNQAQYQVNIQMKEVCNEHKNQIQRICLDKNCQERALCLLCEHTHGGPFQSIMVKTSESYSIFQSAINKAIDTYLLQKEQSTENKVMVEQIVLIKKYFSELKEQFNEFLKVMEKETIQKLHSDEAENFKIIKRARIAKNYVNVPNKIFRILMQIYEGTPFAEVFKNTEGGKIEQAYHFSSKFHDEINDMMEERDFRLRTKLPDIRQIMLREENQKEVVENEAPLQIEMLKPKYEVKLAKEEQIDFESIISDCKKLDDHYVTISYDKTLRLIDKKFGIKGQQEFSNILTKIHPIADQVYAIGQSKQILINNIKYEKKQLQMEKIMHLRGHTEKVTDISSLNTRIIGSSSSEGVKIWDLYKERCEYTLKDEANPTVINFLPASNTLTVAYNSHFLKLYSIQTMKLIKKYQLPGVPLLIDKGKFTQSKFYVGGFPSLLGIVDTRLNKIAFEYALKQGAVTCTTDSLYDQQAVAVGDRDGYCNLFDLRTKKSRISWEAHAAKTSISRPRGVVNIFENSETQWTTVGCNDKTFKVWDVENVQKSF